MNPAQFSLFDAPPAFPDGFAYRAALITPAEEAALVEAIRALPFAPFQFHGFEGNRRVVSFGWRYDFNDGGLKRAEPIRAWLAPLRDRAAGLMGRSGTALEQALVTEYAPGAGIGWHRDRPDFGEVAGVSLGSPCRFRLRRRQGSAWERLAVTAEPRSGYVLKGDVRTLWEHSIPPVDTLRWSVTFRTLRPRA